MTRIIPVVLSGGSGTRLWPVSRASLPKQFLALTSSRTLLQETLLRVADAAIFDAPVLVCNHDHRFLVAEQAQQIGVKPAAILLEPVGRNTAPAVATAALFAQRHVGDALLLVMPSDHVIGDPAAFIEQVTAAAPAASRGALVTFGITPESPETGFGYIRRGKPLADLANCYEVERFVEKPERALAETLMAEGGCYWNAGLFMFSAATYLAELQDRHPEMVNACSVALAKAQVDLDFLRLDPDSFGASPSESIDYAVMEHTRHAAVIPCQIRWSDLGSWKAIWELGEGDTAGNQIVGKALGYDIRNCYLKSDGPLVAAVGVDDLAVVATDDAILVSHKDKVQDVKAVVDALKLRGWDEALQHSLVNRPWGSYRSLVMGDRFQVKHIVVKPGCKLSLQKHFHRAEHWVIAKGTANVTVGDKELLLSENESVYLPLGSVHRLENCGRVPLEIIEVQVGSYLGEDDIVRIDDEYGRAKSSALPGS